MAITLGNGTTTITLPSGLVWEDELAWDPVVQSMDFTLSGAVVVEESTRLAGRPITLVGGELWAWLARTQVQALQALLAPAGVVLTLTLHDARVFRCTPRRDPYPIEGRMLPLVAGSGPADPTATTRYVLERVRLMEIPA